jgi:hypothetical protein
VGSVEHDEAAHTGGSRARVVAASPDEPGDLVVPVSVHVASHDAVGASIVGF